MTTCGAKFQVSVPERKRPESSSLAVPIEVVSAMRAIQFGKEHPPFNVFIIGEGEDRIKLEKQIAMLDLTHRIFLTGFIPDAARILKAFDLFALPSVKEGLPYVLLQAMAAERAIVATAVGGIVDFLEDKKTGLICEVSDPKDIARKINMLVRDRVLRDSIIASALAMVKRSYDWSVIAENMRTKGCLWTILLPKVSCAM